MMYFWLIPALIALFVLLWITYTAATKKPVGRTEGKPLVDKTSEHPEPGKQNTWSSG